MPKVLGNLRGCKALPKCWSRLWFFTPMEVWFAATGLRLHREPGALPSAGAEPGVSLHPTPQMNNQGNAGPAPSTSGTQHSMQMLRWNRCGQWKLLGPTHFCNVVRNVTPLAQPRLNYSLSLPSGVTWGQGQPCSPSVKRTSVGVGQQAETSKGLC